MKCSNRVKKNSMLIAVAVTLTVLLCTVTVQGAAYFTTDGGVPVIPVFANTGAADTAMGTPVQGALIYSTSDGGIMYYDGSAWVSIESLADGTAANNTLRWDGSNWVESVGLTNDDTDVTATGDLAVNGGDITTTAGTANVINTNATTVNIAGASTATAIGAATGTTTIGNDLTATGDADVQGGDLTNTTGALTLTPNAGTNLNVSLSTTGDMVVNTDDLVVDTSAGFVGIGDTAPTAALHVDSGAANTSAIVTVENTAGNFQIFNTNATPEAAITGSSGDLAIDSTAGNIYIKTDDADATDWVSLLGSSIADTDTDTMIQVEEGADDDTIRFDLGHATTPIPDALTMDATNGFIWNEAGDAIDARFEGDTEANLLVLDASADRVGIGTATPDYALDVAGDISLDDRIYHNGDTDTSAYFTNDAFEVQVGGEQWFVLDGPSGYIRVGHQSGNSADIRLAATAAAADLFVEASSGDVGIGNAASSPSSRLHVEESSGATTPIVTIENTAGDFQIFNTNATPEAAITGNSGDLAIDSTAGTIYLKTDDADNTDWVSLTGIMADADSDTAIQVEEGADDDTIRFDLGHATTPIPDALTMDATNGLIWNDAGDDLDVRFEGDTQANLLVLDASADAVGVGTNAPQATLHVANDTNGQLIIEDSSGDNQAVTSYQTASYDWSIGIHGGDSGNFKIGNDEFPNTNARVVIETGTNEVFRIDNSDNVGIGTTAPGSVLHADSSAANTTAILTLENTAGDFQLFRTDASPEASVTGSIGDLAVDGTNGLVYIKNSGNATNTGWLSLTGSISDADGDTLVQVEEGADDDTIRFDLGHATTPIPDALTMDATNGFIWNEAGDAIDARFEGDTEANLLVLDASTDGVGIGDATPDGRVEIRSSGSGDILNLYDSTTNVISFLNDGDIDLESNGNFVRFQDRDYNNSDGSGLTLRTINNPTGTDTGATTDGSIFDIRSSGSTNRLWVGQDFTSSGSNAFGVSFEGTIGEEGNRADYTTLFGESGEDSWINEDGGNVGIGISTPDGKLEVRNSGTEDILNLYDGTTNVLSVLDGGDLDVDSNTLFVDASEDFVGIGESTPLADLHIDAANNTPELTVGEHRTSTADTTGISFGPWSNGNVYIDTKVATGGFLSFRYGEGAQGGPSNTWMQMDGGLLGVGDVTPTTQLHVDSNAANTTAIVTFENTAGDFQVFRTDATPEASVTGNTGDLAIDGTNGNVYVKTDNADATDWVSLLGSSIADTDTDTLIQVEEGADDDTIRFDLGHATTPIPDALTMDATNGFIWNEAGDAIDARFEGDTEANLLVLDASADMVGIGTATPTYELDVVGDIGVDEYIYHNDDTNTYMRFQDDQFNLYTGNFNMLTIQDTTQNVFTVGGGGNDVDFSVTNSGAGGEAFFIEGSSGDARFDTDTLYIDASADAVGVGTNAPQATLHVANDTNGQLIIEDSSGDNQAVTSYQTASYDWSIGIHGGDSGNFKIGNDEFPNINTRVVIETGTNEVFRIDNSDNVGIGDATPDGKLEVRNSGTEDILNLYDGTTNVLSVLDGGDMVVNTDDLVVDTSEGRVGIGTSTFPDATTDTVLETDGIITSERTFQAGVVNISTAAVSVTFDRAFDEVPSVVVTMHQGGSGENPYAVITAISTTGFTVQAFQNNPANSGVGYGATIPGYWIAMARTQ